MNSKFVALSKALPRGSGRGNSQNYSRKEGNPTHKRNKAEVLTVAVTYVKQLEEQNQSNDRIPYYVIPLPRSESSDCDSSL